uniref:Peptidase S1 domain-containing protein n=1 Tax=Bubo bubo TaxID=30461 RepID=A0A8C0FRS2_BUBBB
MPLAAMHLLRLLILLALCWPAHVSGCRGTCGLRPMAADDGTSHVVGGTDAQPGAWPWIVSIQGPWRRGTGHVCGGSLISPQWVLTAAHCFTKARHITTWRVVVGATRLTQLGPEAQVRNIKRLLVHEDYSSTSQRNDIALLELDQPVQCSNSIQLACVPNASLEVSELTTCYISGWGSTMRSTSPTPRAHDLLSDKVLSPPAPEQSLSVQRIQLWGVLAERRSRPLCCQRPPDTTLTLSPPLQGDSGAPLVCKDNSAEYFWLVGVTSWGRGCTRAKRLGIYTSTQHFYDWILEQMGLSPAGTAAPTPQPAFPSTPLQTPRPTPTQSGGFSSFPLLLQKLVELFTWLQELLQNLREGLSSRMDRIQCRLQCTMTISCRGSAC